MMRYTFYLMRWASKGAIISPTPNEILSKGVPLDRVNDLTLLPPRPNQAWEIDCSQENNRCQAVATKNGRNVFILDFYVS